jgi:hypothetical protein
LILITWFTIEDYTFIFIFIVANNIWACYQIITD